MSASGTWRVEIAWDVMSGAAGVGRHISAGRGWGTVVTSISACRGPPIHHARRRETGAERGVGAAARLAVVDARACRRTERCRVTAPCESAAARRIRVVVATSDHTRRADPLLLVLAEEAEDQAAAMAAETIRDYVETGTIRNSVNFPETSLPDRPENAIRMTVVNKNIPGMLAHITEMLAKAELNIIQQINHSRGDIAYNVLDIDPTGGDGATDGVCLKDLQRDLTMLDGVLSSRILFGNPGAGYARNVDGQYFI